VSTVLEVDHERFHKDNYRPKYCTSCWPDAEVVQPEGPLSTSGAQHVGSLFYSEAVVPKKTRALLNKPRLDFGPDESIPRELLPWCARCSGTRRIRINPDAQPGEKGFAETKLCDECFASSTLTSWLDQLWDDLPELFRPWEFATFPSTTPAQVRAIESMQALVDDPRLPWAALYGPTGRGKTGLAVAAAKEIMRRHHRQAKVIRAHDILIRLRSTYGSKSGLQATEYTIINSLRAIPCLVIDDLGQEQDSDWALAELYGVIGTRHDDKKQTIITSNWPLTKSNEKEIDLGDKLGLALSRRIHEMTRDRRYRIDFTGLPYLSNAG
jgi:DNA replication protein DnaC